MEETKTPVKPSYEELEKIALNLKRDLMAINNAMTRLEYLFRVVDNAEVFDKDFIKEVTEEIKNILTIKKA